MQKVPNSRSFFCFSPYVCSHDYQNSLLFLSSRRICLLFYQNQQSPWGKMDQYASRNRRKKLYRSRMQPYRVVGERHRNEQTLNWTFISSFWYLTDADKTNKPRNEIQIRFVVLMPCKSCQNKHKTKRNFIWRSAVCSFVSDVTHKIHEFFLFILSRWVFMYM